MLALIFCVCIILSAFINCSLLSIFVELLQHYYVTRINSTPHAHSYANVVFHTRKWNCHSPLNGDQEGVNATHVPFALTALTSSARSSMRMTLANGAFPMEKLLRWVLVVRSVLVRSCDGSLFEFRSNSDVSDHTGQVIIAGGWRRAGKFCIGTRCTGAARN